MIYYVSLKDYLDFKCIKIQCLTCEVIFGYIFISTVGTQYVFSNNAQLTEVLKYFKYKKDEI